MPNMLKNVREKSIHFNSQLIWIYYYLLKLKLKLHRSISASPHTKPKSAALPTASIFRGFSCRRPCRSCRRLTNIRPRDIHCWRRLKVLLYCNILYSFSYCVVFSISIYDYKCEKSYSLTQILLFLFDFFYTKGFWSSRRWAKNTVLLNPRKLNSKDKTKSPQDQACQKRYYYKIIL